MLHNVEKKSNLKDAGIKPIAYMPKGDKMARVQIVSPYIEAGIVHLLNRPENLLFLEEAAKFPNASSRDYVDTLSQVLGFLRDQNMLTIPKDPPPEITVASTQVPYFKSPN